MMNVVFALKKYSKMVNNLVFLMVVIIHFVLIVLEDGDPLMTKELENIISELALFVEEIFNYEIYI
jgi:hypothetical protein